MKILFDHQIFSWQEYGGISRYIYELALKMAVTFDHDVSIVSPLYINKYLKQAPDELETFGMPIKGIPRTGRILRAVNFILAWPTMRYCRPDIVHETYYSSRRIAPKSAKVILTVHDMIHEKFSDDFRKNDPTSRDKALAVARADHIICVSEKTREDLIELLDVDRVKTSVVHHGFTLTNGRIFRQDSSTTLRPFLLYVGLRGGYKNFEGLIQAYAKSPALRNNFDLICFGGGRLTANEKNQIKRLGLSIECVRQVSGDDKVLAGYYRAASAFIYPSLYEGFGIPPLEAMSYDCPVVCSGVSSIPEVVGDAGEMFDPYEPDSIRTAIERVVSDEALRLRLISRGQERLKLFSWDRCAKETLDVYRKVLS